MRFCVLFLSIPVLACGDSPNEPATLNHGMLGTFHMVGPRIALHAAGTPCEIYLVGSTITTENNGNMVRRDSIESDGAYGISTPGTAALSPWSREQPAERAEITHAGRVRMTCGAPEFSAGAHFNVGQLLADTLLLGLQHEVTGVASPRIQAVRYER